MPSYEDYIKYFGSPEAYAEAIKKKTQQGQALTDPEAAAAFRSAYPQLFQTGSITTFGSTQRPPAGTVPVRQYLVSRGYDPTKIGWQQGTVTLGGQYGITPSAVLEGRAYAPRSTIEAALKALGYQSPEEQQAAARQKSIENMVQALIQSANRPLKYNPEEDPRYQAARQLAEAEAGRASQAAMEELNARGILPSTITADRLGQIRQRAAESVAGMIPSLYQAAMQERQAQIGNLGTVLNALMGVQQATQAQEQAQWQRALQEAGLTGEYMGAPTWQAAQAEREWGRQTALDEWNKALQEAGLTGMWRGQPTWERLVQEAGLTGMWQGQPTWERQYQERQLANALARATSGGGTTRLTTTEYATDVKQKVTAGVQAALDELWRQFPEGPSYMAVRDKAQGALNRAKADMVRAGLSKKDIDDMIESLKGYITAVTGVPLEEEIASPLAQEKKQGLLSRLLGR